MVVRDQWGKQLDGHFADWPPAGFVGEDLAQFVSVLDLLLDFGFQFSNLIG